MRYGAEGQTDYTNHIRYRRNEDHPTMEKTHADPHGTERQRPIARRLRKGALGVGAVIVGALLALAVPAIASAHAYLVSADPWPGAIVKAAPTTITLHFAENVNPQ